MQIVSNPFIKSASLGFFKKGLNRGSYGLEITLENCVAPSGPVYVAVKQLVEVALPPSNKRIRIDLPENFTSRDTLRWLLAALARFDFHVTVMFFPAFGEPELLKLATWRVLKMVKPEMVFVDFDELWFIADDKTIDEEFPIWPIGHPVWLFVHGLGLGMESVVNFVSKTPGHWAMLSE